MRSLKDILVFGIILIKSLDGHGQSIYKLSEVPDSLFHQANAIYLDRKLSYEIIDLEKVSVQEHVVVAILNNKGAFHAFHTMDFDDDSEIRSFSSSVYNKEGQLIKTSRKKDYHERSNISGFSIYEDSKVLEADLRQAYYPYIVEYEHEIELKETYSAPSFYAAESRNASVLNAELLVSSPAQLFPNVKIENNPKFLFELSSENEINKIARFELHNMKALDIEPHGPGFRELMPVVICSPTQFSYDGYVGSFNSWKELGLWQNQLNAGRNQISEKTIEEIKELTAPYESIKDKVKAVYKYMQNRTRYVSIQLGIGGWQPFPASTVEELGYGDCKALTNYTNGLLKAIGIESYYTKVYGGSDPPKIDRSFPKKQFNHIILCVPNEQDTLWLECTSQTNPFGYLGKFTGDRDVLIVTPEGGEVVHTKKYLQSDNTQFTTASINLDQNGYAQGQFQVEYSGIQYENDDLNRIINDGDEVLKKWIVENTPIENLEVRDFSFHLIESEIPKISESVQFEAEGLMNKNGRRHFLSPNLLNRWNYVPKKTVDRKTDIVIKNSFIDTDSIKYLIPNNLAIEYKPETINIQTPFGSYQSEIHVIDQGLQYIRRIKWNKGRFSKLQYEAFRQFYLDISRGDNAKVVFVEK